MPEFQIALTNDRVAVADFGQFSVLTRELLEEAFAQLDKPAFPCRYFDHTDPALAWLRTFL